MSTFIGRVYKRKSCECKFCIIDTKVVVDELDLTNSYSVFVIKMINYCNHEHVENISPDIFELKISTFGSDLASSYSRPELDHGKTLEYKGKYRKYTKEKEELDKYEWVE